MNTSSEALALRKDTKVISMISGAHAFSHFYQLTLPPLFPLLHSQEGYSYTQLGTLIALFYLVSGVVQPLAGFLVDRIGPRVVLYTGMGFLAGATALYGVADNYPTLLFLAALAGVGNGVFHPSDYTVLSNNITERRVGRGFSFHAFGGYIGYAMAPVLVISLATLLSWREATIWVGSVGLVFVMALIVCGHDDLHVEHGDRSKSEHSSGNSALLLRVVIVGCFLFFCAIAMAQIGLQTFAPSALLSLYETPITVSNIGITVFLIAVTVGILLGGIVADRAQNHHRVAMLCLLPPALLSLLPAWFEFPHWALWGLFALIGLIFGVLIPSRDMLVRAAAPRAASGRVFGVVYSGLDVGSAATPFAFGWLMDHDLPAWVFLGSGACFALGIFAIMLSRSSNQKSM